MNVHPREAIVEEAGYKLIKAWVEIRDSYDLTNGECLRIIANILSTDAKYIIRAERHPENPDMPGGLAEENEDD